MLAAFGQAGLVRIRPNGIEGEIPKRFSRRDIPQTHVAGFGRVRFSHPPHAEVNAIATVVQSDDFLDRELRLDASKLNTGAAYVDGGGFLREHCAGVVSAEDAYGYLNVFSRFAALSHLSGNPVYAFDKRNARDEKRPRFVTLRAPQCCTGECTCEARCREVARRVPVASLRRTSLGCRGDQQIPPLRVGMTNPFPNVELYKNERINLDSVL